MTLGHTSCFERSAAVLLLGLGCSDDPPPTLETEHLRFHDDLDGTCEALGTLYEREVARIEASLDREFLEPVDVHMGDAAVERWCSGSVNPGERLPGGCAVSGTVLATSLDSLSHELVHALRLQHGIYGVALIEEGLATIYGSSRPSVPASVDVDASDPDVAPIPRLEHRRLEEAPGDRSIGAHFLHWVDETYGRDRFLAFVWSDGMQEEDPDAVQAAFAEAIGETMLAAQERWSEESDYEATFADLCYGIDTAPLPAAGLLVEGSAYCTDPSAEQGDRNRLRLGSRCFTLPAPTALRVELLVGDGLVLRTDGCGRTIVSLDRGESETLTAEACRWKVFAESQENSDEPVGFRYAITPL